MIFFFFRPIRQNASQHFDSITMSEVVLDKSESIMVKQLYSPRKLERLAIQTILRNVPSLLKSQIVLSERMSKVIREEAKVILMKLSSSFETSVILVYFLVHFF